jgi:ATP-dependent DNA helicase DinG
VVITRLPFAVPDDPVEATLSEWVRSQGGQPFRDVTLPDAARRLVQASGRLLRTEQDRGRITVLDARLITRRYGQQILQSLPNYRLETS